MDILTTIQISNPNRKCRHRQKKRKPKGKRARQSAFFKAVREEKEKKKKQHHHQEKMTIKNETSNEGKQKMKRRGYNLDEDNEEEEEDLGIRFLVQEEKRAQKNHDDTEKRFEISIPDNQSFEMIDEYQYKTPLKTSLILPSRQGLLPSGGGPIALPSRNEWIQDFRARFEEKGDETSAITKIIPDEAIATTFRPITKNKDANFAFSLFDTIPLSN